MLRSWFEFCLCRFQVFGLIGSGRHASFFCEMLKTCSHLTLVLKLSCFDLSVVHLALSGSVVGSSARFCNKMNLRRSSIAFTPEGRICDVSWESGISFALLGVVFLFAFKSQL